MREEKGKWQLEVIGDRFEIDHASPVVVDSDPLDDEFPEDDWRAYLDINSMADLVEYLSIFGGKPGFKLSLNYSVVVGGDAVKVDARLEDETAITFSDINPSRAKNAFVVDVKKAYDILGELLHSKTFGG